MPTVRISGTGGQGVVTLGTLLGEAGFLDNQNVAVCASYGVQSRGGASTSEVIISSNEILYPLVEDADIFIVLSQNGYDEAIEATSPGGTVIYNASRIQQIHDTPKHYPLLATDLALEHFDNQMFVNMLMLGATVQLTKLVNKNAVIEAIEANLSNKFLTKNLEAFNLGYNTFQ